MSNDCEPPLPVPDYPEVGSVSEDMETHDSDEAAGAARIWVWVPPIVVVHLALIYNVAREAFDVELPAYLHVDLIAAWLWVNGAAIGLGIWFWKRGRVPIGKGRWLHGRRARLLIPIWLAVSLAWFLLPAVLDDAWDALSRWHNRW